MRNLDEINKNILDEIDKLNIENNMKDFLKEALYIEYYYRDENHKRKNMDYEPLIEKYCEVEK